MTDTAAMADASPGTRRGGLRRSSQSRSHNPPALRPRESRSPDRVASRGQRGECRCSGPSAGGGRDGGGQDRRRRSPSVPGRGRSGSRSRGPPAAAKVAAPEILGAAANAADATPGPDRGDCPLNWRVGRARRCSRFRSWLSIEFGVDLVGRGAFMRTQELTRLFQNFIILKFDMVFSVEAGGHFYYRPPSDFNLAPRTRDYPAAPGD